jgi:hypothetical protein
MPTRRKRGSACTNFSKTLKNCKEPCKIMHRKIKDAHSGMERIIGYCKTKYLKKLKKHGKRTQKKHLVKMANSITDLENTAKIAMKANEAFAEKAPKVLEQTSENTNTIGKTVVDTISKAMDTVQKTFVTSEEPPASKVAPASSEVPSPEVVPASPEVVPSSPEEPIKVQMKTGGK